MVYINTYDASLILLRSLAEEIVKVRKDDYISAGVNQHNNLRNRPECPTFSPSPSLRCSSS